VGTYEGWLKGIKLIEPYLRVRLGFYAAFVPPMLPIFKSDNFIMDYSGSTFQGKTTTLRVGASVWGKPGRDGREGTAMHDWNTTQTWRERAPTVMNHIPLFLDDSKTVRHPDEIAQTVYRFTQGRSRGRGTLAGLAQQLSFESVLFSSGERPVVSFGTAKERQPIRKPDRKKELRHDRIGIAEIRVVVAEDGKYGLDGRKRPDEIHEEHLEDGIATELIQRRAPRNIGHVHFRVGRSADIVGR